MKVYLSHPYGRRAELSQKEIEANVESSIGVARELIVRGHTPLVPLLYHFIHSGWEASPDEDRWNKICRAWVEDCDALLLLGTSEGCMSELFLAMALKKQIYIDLEQIPYVSA